MTETVDGNNSPANETSLEALAASLTVPSKSSDAPAAPAPAPAVETTLPDMTADPEGFKKAVEGYGMTMKELSDFVSSSRAKEADSKLTGDINSAVDVVASQIEGVDKNVIRAVLKDRAETDPAFSRIWAARDSNPDQFQKALGLLSQQYREQFAPRVNSQVEADQRAFRDSINSARGGRANEISTGNSQWDAKSDAEFDRDFARLSGSAGA